MKIFQSVFILVLITISLGISAQDISHLIKKEESNSNKINVRIIPEERFSWAFGYNFVRGNDSKDFSTTINGLGSGFLFGLSKARIGWDWISIDYNNLSLSFGAGIALSKYRFPNPIQFTPNQNGGVNYSNVLSETATFNSHFFSHDKSKLSYWSFYLPIHFNVKLKKCLLSAGIFADIYLGGKTKFKFHENGKSEKETFRLYSSSTGPMNPIKFGFNFEIRPNTKFYIPSIGYSFMVNPLFKPGKGPELYEHRISFIYPGLIRLCGLENRKLSIKNGRLKLGPKKCKPYNYLEQE
ncbi:MAG: hypothetical protein JEZ03_06065 [Bacteroidales bacterium]|nr:hypothetical protein [Bacteroidales bacterium]